ncbi:MAG: hypothetical protein JOS17DRAFT_248666 [Linnemannia elongata]|nr:MAG: hypothetical protein JOS17DRAFT_248666 [Linnemannia elongata]
MPVDELCVCLWCFFLFFLFAFVSLFVYPSVITVAALAVVYFCFVLVCVCCRGAVRKGPLRVIWMFGTGESTPDVASTRYISLRLTPISSLLPPLPLLSFFLSLSLSLFSGSQEE